MIALGHSAGGALVGLMGVSLVESGLAPATMVLPMTLLAGIGSHYIGDWLPHGHYRFDLKADRNKSLLKLGLDLVVPVVLLLCLASQKFGLGSEWWLVAAGIVGALLPDVFENLVDLKALPSGQFAAEHRAFHYDKLHARWQDPTSPLPNHARRLGILDIYQFALLGLAVYLLV